MRSFEGSAFVYSGRVDPTWPVDEVVAERLLAIWDDLEPFAGDVPGAPPLGYRGCSLKGPDGVVFLSFGGVVSRDEGSKTDSRTDVNRAFEKLLLSSAPDGALPTDLAIE